jgi:hypothetical protein
MTEAFWSIPIAEKDKHKTAFASQSGLWEWNSMPFGLSNAPAQQQQFMDMILAGLQWESCVVYVDDIVIFSKSFDEHYKTLEDVLTRLKKHRLRLNLNKVKLCQSKFKLLGYTANKEGIEANDAKVHAILNYPTPTTPGELNAFLGVVSWCRRFIYRCARKTRKMRDILKSGSFLWTQEAQQEFEEMKESVARLPLLKHPDFNKTFYVHVDASKKGYGAILTQRVSDPLDKPATIPVGIPSDHHVIAFASLAKPDAHSTYNNSERETYCL